MITKRRVLSILLAIAMVMGLLPGMSSTALADDMSETFDNTTSNYDGRTYSGEHFEIRADSGTGDGLDIGVENNRTVRITALHGETIKKVEMTIGRVSSNYGGGSILSTSGAVNEGTYTANQTVTLNNANASTITLSNSTGRVWIKTWKIYYTAAAVAVTSISLDPSSSVVALGGTQALTASVTPADAADKTVKWSVNNDNVKLYTDANCTAGNEVGTDAIANLTVYAKGISVGNSRVTVTSNANSDATAGCNVRVRYSVTLSGGANAVLGAISNEGGSYSTGYLSTPEGIGCLLSDFSTFFTVVYTANSGYEFPESSDCYTTTSGVKVTRTSATQLTITGEPTADVSVAVPDAVHVHDFIYSASGATITATCGNAGCALTSDPALTVDAPTITTYGGTGSATASLTGLEAFNTATGLSVSEESIKYYEATKSGETYTKSGGELSAAPTDAGDYVAEVTISDVKTVEGDSKSVTASVGYTIAKAATTITTAPTAGEITYGQTLADSTLTGGEASVAGSFAWKDLTVAPAVSDSQKTEYDVVFTPTDENYRTAECKAKLTVGKATPTVTAPTAKSLTCNEQAQELVNAGKADGGEMRYALGTATEATEPYTTSIPAKTDVGTYYVWYKVVGDENHVDSEAASVSVTIAAPSYAATSGTGSTWTKGSKEGLSLTFKRSDEGAKDMTFSHFASASVDGKELARDTDYVAAKGSVVITLAPAYLEKLGSGKHTLTASFDDGSAEAAFTVAEADATVTVTFDANSGKGTMAKMSVAAGETVSLTKNAFTRDGYTFSGWNTKANGSGTSYKDGASVKVSSDMILYAQWTKNAASSSSKTTTSGTSSTLARTGDPTSAAAVLASAAIGVAALAGGWRRRR